MNLVCLELVRCCAPNLNYFFPIIHYYGIPVTKFDFDFTVRLPAYSCSPLMESRIQPWIATPSRESGIGAAAYSTIAALNWVPRTQTIYIY